jgi:hypothetical protein
MLGELGFEPATNGGVGAREVEPVEHSAYVQRRTAHHDRQDAAGPAVGDRRTCSALELRHRCGFADVENVDQVMAYAVTLSR